MDYTEPAAGASQPHAHNYVVIMSTCNRLDAGRRDRKRLHNALRVSYDIAVNAILRLRPLSDLIQFGTDSNSKYSLVNRIRRYSSGQFGVRAHLLTHSRKLEPTHTPHNLVDSFVLATETCHTRSWHRLHHHHHFVCHKTQKNSKVTVASIGRQHLHLFRWYETP